MASLSPIRSPRRPRAGFTLLEMLLAITVLATLTALVAALWRQMGDWSGEGSKLQEALRLPRVVELLRAQWAERRSNVGMKDTDEGWSVQPGVVEFVTTLPILDPSRPLVHVAYAVERDLESAGVGAERWRLVYFERPIVDPSARLGTIVSRRQDGMLVQDAELRPATGSSPFGIIAARPARMILLTDCTELRLEYFDDGTAARERRARRFEEDAARSEGRPSNNLAQKGDDSDPGDTGDEILTRWRLIEKQTPKRPPALRLGGVYQGEGFSCVLVLPASRS